MGDFPFLLSARYFRRFIPTSNICSSCSVTLKSHRFTLYFSAPVKVSIQHAGNRITCSSEGIYPKPELTWSTRPPSKVTFKNTTTVEQTKQQLYNINGSLIASFNESDRVYSCTVSTQRNRRRASLRQLREYDLTYELGNEVESCLLLNTETHALDLHRSTSCVGCSSIPGICSTFLFQLQLLAASLKPQSPAPALTLLQQASFGDSLIVQFWKRLGLVPTTQSQRSGSSM